MDEPKLRVYRFEKIGLDPITVYIEQFRPGTGRMTVQCYARAWTGFWGSHGEEAPLEAFIATSPSDYIADGLIWGTRGLTRKKNEKSDEAYLQRIVRAIQEHFKYREAQ